MAKTSEAKKAAPKRATDNDTTVGGVMYYGKGHDTSKTKQNVGSLTIRDIDPYRTSSTAALPAVFADVEAGTKIELQLIVDDTMIQERVNQGKQEKDITIAGETFANTETAWRSFALKFKAKHPVSETWHECYLPADRSEVEAAANDDDVANVIFYAYVKLRNYKDANDNTVTQRLVTKPVDKDGDGIEKYGG